MDGREPRPELPLFEDDTLIEHATLCWRSECENAERLERQISFMLSGLVALFGLGLFRLEWTMRANDQSRVESGLVVLLVKAALTAGMFCFVAAGMRLFARRRGAPPPPLASSRLELPESLFRRPDAGLPHARRAVFTSVYRAYLEIREQNDERAYRIRRAQWPFSIGVGLVLAAIILYLWMSVPLGWR